MQKEYAGKSEAVTTYGNDVLGLVRILPFCAFTFRYRKYRHFGTLFLLAAICTWVVVRLSASPAFIGSLGLQEYRVILLSVLFVTHLVLIGLSWSLPILFWALEKENLASLELKPPEYFSRVIKPLRTICDSNVMLCFIIGANVHYSVKRKVDSHFGFGAMEGEILDYVAWMTAIGFMLCAAGACTVLFWAQVYPENRKHAWLAACGLFLTFATASFVYVLLSHGVWGWRVHLLVVVLLVGFASVVRNALWKEP